ncbi:hypothetical protein A2368_00695 [Candidatus Collierbacteria bacterium RIFOXYB1_FULL_49_13]|uniref:DUF4258 domain-containing protein n=1 Tax=Candidatus Collierbacteria bacterium RIFOXYB1_FULL_49_13 TaxID=1817728 RepID=A0A1F5FHE8_9BACT|nr:MAG: hypothetical protein A2368_00695 [Candidatus Collierbacteria bacterium RIFOXYB1_FULL_49_13]
MSHIAHTHHLEERSAQRSIHPAEVDQTLKFPDHREHLGGPKYKFFKYLNGRTIVVIANTATKPWVVLTTWSKPGSFQPRKRPGWNTVDRFVWETLKGIVRFLYHLFHRSH